VPESWSLIPEIILVILTSTLLVKISSIRVAELSYTRVGLSKVEINEKLFRESKKS